MFQGAQVIDGKGEVRIPGPPIARFLFRYTAAGWLWLLVRIWVGWQWFFAGLGKLHNPAWMDGSGRAITSFWQRAVAIPKPPDRPAITYHWYRDFIQFLIDTGSSGWFSYLIVFGELAVGLGLILGAFVGLAATGGLTICQLF
jgi:thiosulfate dehydrogenase [quinone] large subunit